MQSSGEPLQEGQELAAPTLAGLSFLLLDCVALGFISPAPGKEADKSTRTEKGCRGEAWPRGYTDFPFCWTEHFLGIGPERQLLLMGKCA